MRHLLALLVVLLLCVDGWGCGDAEGDSCPEEAYGWVCDAECQECTCDGYVHPVPGTIGECREREGS